MGAVRKTGPNNVPGAKSTIGSSKFCPTKLEPWGWIKESFTLIAVGWHWNKKARSRPIIVEVFKQSGSESFQVTYQNRLWHYPRQQGLPFIAFGHPRSNYSNEDCEALCSKLANKNWPEAELILVEEIKRIGGSNRYVGQHVLTVTLSPPNAKRGLITDFPSQPILHPIRSSFIPNLVAEV